MVSNLTVKIGADIDGLKKELNNATSSLSSFSNKLGSMVAGLGAAFGVQQVAQFALEVSKLAGEADGVRAAFDRLPNSINLMNDLRQATGNTVSELALMKRAVQASNFDISLSALPKLLEFATLRAQQTGQSVDYLVDSIVTGIGRKSKLILDNLGISAVALDEKLNGVSVAAASVGQVADAVGQIAAESLDKMGKLSDNAATKLQRLAASWDNLKVSIGDNANSTGVLSRATDTLGDAMDVLASNNISALEKWGAALAGGFQPAVIASLKALDEFRKSQAAAAEEIKASTTTFNEFGMPTDAFGNFSDRFGVSVEKQVTTLDTLKAKLAELNQTFGQLDISNTDRLSDIGNEIIATQEQIKALEDLKKAYEGVGAALMKTSDTQTPVSGAQNNPTGSGFLFDLGMLDKFAFTAENALAKIDSSLINNEISLEQWAESMRIHFDEYQKSVVDFSGVVNSALSGIGQAFGSAMSGSQNLGEALLGVLGGVLIQVGEMILAVGIGVEAFKTSLKSLQGAPGIVAGLALIALGTAVASSMRNIGATAGNSNSSAARSGASSSGGRAGNISDQGLEIRVVGETRIQGNDLWIILNRQNEINGRTRG